MLFPNLKHLLCICGVYQNLHGFASIAPCGSDDFGDFFLCSRDDVVAKTVFETVHRHAHGNYGYRSLMCMRTTKNAFLSHLHKKAFFILQLSRKDRGTVLLSYLIFLCQENRPLVLRLFQLCFLPLTGISL